MFAQNIRLLIGILVFLAVAFIALVASWTGIRVWLFTIRRRRAEADAKRRRTGKDGKPLPPRGRGICDMCGTVPDSVFYLDTGERLCQSCLAARDATAHKPPHKETAPP